jgi:hypothetical protein
MPENMGETWVRGGKTVVPGGRKAKISMEVRF